MIVLRLRPVDVVRGFDPISVQRDTLIEYSWLVGVLHLSGSYGTLGGSSLSCYLAREPSSGDSSERGHRVSTSNRTLEIYL